ncbi:hypothetical protein DID88_006714 [Monilinia fructigena]|uniref:Uncharacterized protein n=1 Tax=Monilinia fructigena TaxID=38457 RepID=A0A395II85_9HELO|nr:hypothetical protein DID88_006714 [Monilinia fructigena]
MTDFNPNMVDLDTADPAAIVCYLELGENEYNGRLGARIAALFVILIVSSAATFFPVLAAKNTWFRINIYVYFVRSLLLVQVLLSPRLSFTYLIPPIVLLSVLSIFMMDFGAEQYVDRKYGFAHGPSIEDVITDHPGTNAAGGNAHRAALTHNQIHSGDQDPKLLDNITSAQQAKEISPASNSFTNEKNGLSDVEQATLNSENDCRTLFPSTNLCIPHP